MSALTCSVTCSGAPASPVDTAVGEPWTTVVYAARGSALIAVALRLVNREGDPAHPGDRLTDARTWAVMLGLTTIGPTYWPATPETCLSFSRLRHRVLEAALSDAWYQTELCLDDRPRPAQYLALPHGAMAVAATTGWGLVALGSRGADPASLQLRRKPLA